MDGLSMLPNLAETGEVVVEDCLTYKFSPIQRGDLVTLKSPLDPSRIICKRVLGLPGDIVCVDPTGQLAPSTQHVIVPKGHIWIMGDNATHSRDSREYGPVPIALVQARLAYRVSLASFSNLRVYMPVQIWPLQRFARFSNYMTFLN